MPCTEVEIDLGSIFASPSTFCESGPIEDAVALQILQAATELPDNAVGNMTKAYFHKLRPADAGVLIKEIIDKLPSDVVGRFLKGRSVERLRRT